MEKEDRDYLFFRCRTSWHRKYYHYIEEWISRITPAQLEYFKREKDNLIKLGIYDARK